MDGWEQINGAELYKGQRPALHKKRYSVPPDRQNVSSVGDTHEAKYSAIVTPSVDTMQSNPEPSAPSSVIQDWEAIDTVDNRDEQASAPELPMGIQTPPQTTAASPAAYSKGEPPLIQMQGLHDLHRDLKGPMQADSAALPARVQAADVPTEGSPAPLTDGPVARVPRVLRRLQAGDRLAAGDRLESSNGLSTAILQHDGNFVVYNRKNLLKSASKAAWSTETYEHNRRRLLKGHELFAQEDGNLVLYTVDRKVAWASNTDAKRSDAYTLEVTDSGALVWYCETSGDEVWTSKHH